MWPWAYFREGVEASLCIWTVYVRALEVVLEKILTLVVVYLCAEHTSNNSLISCRHTGLARTTSREALLEMIFREQMYHTSGSNLETWYAHCSRVTDVKSFVEVTRNPTHTMLHFSDLEKWNETGLPEQQYFNNRRPGPVRCLPLLCISHIWHGNHTSYSGIPLPLVFIYLFRAKSII